MDLLFIFVLVIKLLFAADPVPVVPSLKSQGIGEDHVNVSFIPGDYDEADPRPVGNGFLVRYRHEGEDDWQTKQPDDQLLEVHVDGLDSGTKYDFQVVALQVLNMI